VPSWPQKPLPEAGAESRSKVGGSPPASTSLKPGDFARLSEFIERNYGIRMPPSKRTLLESRLGRRVHELGMSGFSEYCDHVLSGRSSEEIVEMVDRVTTNKTDFFREPHHFELLVRAVLPALGQHHGAGARRDLRAWSAGCATGEEPFTLAMVLSETLPQPPQFQILATDLSTRALRRARDGVYQEAAIEPIPLALRRKYLVRSTSDENLVRFRRALRDRIQFRQLNLLDRDYRIAPPVDVVFCRNVFIYFDRQLQEQILLRFARTMVSGGFLFLGHSETINGLNVPFDAIAPTVYRRRSLDG